jgi:hypothetical protein
MTYKNVLIHGKVEQSVSEWQGCTNHFPIHPCAECIPEDMLTRIFEETIHGWVIFSMAFARRTL